MGQAVRFHKRRGKEQDISQKEVKSNFYWFLKNLHPLRNIANILNKFAEA